MGLDSTLEAYILEEHTQQIDRILAQLEKTSDRLHVLEHANTVRTSNLSILREGMKYWPALIFLLAVIDYGKIIEAVKSFVHIGA